MSEKIGFHSKVPVCPNCGDEKILVVNLVLANQRFSEGDYECVCTNCNAVGKRGNKLDAVNAFFIEKDYEIVEPEVKTITETVTKVVYKCKFVEFIKDLFKI